MFWKLSENLFPPLFLINSTYYKPKPNLCIPINLLAALTFVTLSTSIMGISTIVRLRILHLEPAYGFS